MALTPPPGVITAVFCAVALAAIGATLLVCWVYRIRPTWWTVASLLLVIALLLATLILPALGVPLP